MNAFFQDLILGFSGSAALGVELFPVLFRVFLSLLLSSAVGCERSSKRHSAGLRTFMLVSLSSTLAMLMDLGLGLQIPLISAASVLGAVMISGNSILFSSKNQIKGLTTSAALWSCGLIGLAIGAGFYGIALIFFAALLGSLSLFPALERFLKDRSNHFDIHLELKNRGNLQDFIATLRGLGTRVDDIELNPAYLNSGLSVYSISLTLIAKKDTGKSHSDMIKALASLDYVSYIEEMN